MNEVPQTIRGVAVSSFNAFQGLINQGIIRVGQAREDVTEKIGEIHKRRQQNNQEDE